MKNRQLSSLTFLIVLALWGGGMNLPCWGREKAMPKAHFVTVAENPGINPDAPEDNLNLPPAIIQDSPVLQRWQKQIPNLLEDIQQDPSFRTRFRVGYNQFPSSSNTSGMGLGLLDWGIESSPLTLDADYETNFGDRQSGGLNLNYYVLPLGSYLNIAPLVGYRYIQTNDYHTQGLNVGGKIMFALSRTGAADLSFSQSFVSPGSENEVGISTLSVGYAISNHWRIATDLEQQNSKVHKDNRVGMYLEWTP
jgi:hypothetical protein